LNIHYTATALNSGWTNTDFVITAKSGYKVSLTNTAAGTWSDSLPAYTAETNNGSVTFYVKNTTTGEISVAKTESYNIDKIVPTAKVKYKTNGFKSFLNTISFGLFFKADLDVTIQGADTGSGVAKVDYYKTDAEVTNPQTIPTG